MSRFIRFVAGTDSEDAFGLDGVITAAEGLRRDGQLYDHEEELLSVAFSWLNTRLPCPPFRESLRAGKWSRNALSWFKDEASGPIRKIWDIIAILREHGVAVRVLTTERPGKIVYEDEYQIVAETPNWIRSNV